MAIQASAGRVQLFVVNRLDINPPIQFQNFDATSNFSISLWVNIPNPSNFDAILGYEGSGIQTAIVRDAHTWFLQTYGNNATIFNQPIANVPQDFGGRWQLICISKVGHNITVYSGLDPIDNTPAILAQTANFQITNSSFNFIQFELAPSHNTAMCCVKYWNTALTMAQFQEQGNRWDATSPSGGPTPMWCSTLRSPGDLSNIAYPYTSPDWEAGHAYAAIGNQGGIERMFGFDPTYLAQEQPCPTWVYPLVGPNRVTTVTFNPGVSPTIPTLYKSTQFFEFQDRGSVPSVLHFHQNLNIQYFGFPFASGAGYPQSDTFPLMHDENGVEVSPDLLNPANRFEQDTGIDITGITPTLTTKNIYIWKFGAQFQWQPQATQGPTATGSLGYPRLLVTFIEVFVTGVPSPPVDDLTGLFALNVGGQSVDLYYRGTTLRIPDPTVRTAYIGE